MIFDDILNKLNSFQSKQNEIVVKLLSTFETHFYSGNYNFKLETTYEALKIPENEKLFKFQKGRNASLFLAYENLEIKYHFDANYPTYFHKSFTFRENNSSIIFYLDFDIIKKEEHLTNVIYEHLDNTITYRSNIKQLTSIDFSRKEITYYDAILKNIEDKNLKDFLLICHDLKIEKNDNYDCFINLLKHVQTTLDINNHLLNTKNIGRKNDI